MLRCHWRLPASRDLEFYLLVRWVGLVSLVSVDNEFGNGVKSISFVSGTFSFVTAE